MGLFRRKQTATIDPDERSPQLGLKYKDLALLEQMVKMGADFDEPRHVLYFSYFPTRQGAERASSLAAADGFDCTVDDVPDSVPSSWSLRSELHDHVLTIDQVRSNDDYFDALADAHGGEFDGWEASI